VRRGSRRGESLWRGADPRAECPRRSRKRARREPGSRRASAPSQAPAPRERGPGVSFRRGRLLDALILPDARVPDFLDGAGRPADLDAFDHGRLSEPEVDPRVARGEVALPRAGLPRLAARFGLDGNAGADPLPVRLPADEEKAQPLAVLSVVA